LFGAPNELNESPEVGFKFSFNLIGYSQFSEECIIIAHAQILVRRWGAQNKGLGVT